MSDKRYEANIIRATAVEPANNLESTSAPGVWSIDEVVELQKKSKWPTVGNVATNVENVFSTFLYDGTGATQNIENGISLGNSNDGGSVEFDGTGDYLNLSTPVVPASGQFSLEAFIYPTATSDEAIASQHSNGTTGRFIFRLDNGKLNFNWAASELTDANSITANAWSHCLVTRDASNVIRLFVNGALRKSTTNSVTFDQTNFTIGASRIASPEKYFNGFISNVRVVSGAIPTDYQTSSTTEGAAIYTTPTTGLTAVSNTALLTCQGSTPLVDNSSNSYAITSNADATARAFGPFTGTGGEGGLVWAKSRSSRNHILSDTARGTGKVLFSNSTSAEDADATTITSYNSNGFTMGSSTLKMNTSGEDFVSWTFRKAPKFFDVVTWTGNATAGRTVSHNLGSVPGMIIVKCTSETQHWAVYHRSQGATKYALLSNTDAFSTYAGTWNNTEPTSTEITLGTDGWVNRNGRTYVAYLFAHNNNDGGFGPDQDGDIIKCGSVTADGSGNFTESLGFEPQFILFKAADQTEGWEIFDGMRNLTAVRFYNTGIEANSSAAEGSGSKNLQINADGFTCTGGVSANITYIYMAIRRGPLAAPTDATKVFAMDAADGSSNNPTYVSGFPVDMGLYKRRTGTPSWRISSRLTQGEYMETSSTVAQQANQYHTYDFQNGYFSYAENSNHQAWMWKRAPSYFDVCCYSGTGSARTVSHNLGVAPEMIWVKRRDSTRDWATGFGSLGWTKRGPALNSNEQAYTVSTWWNDTAPTSSVFTVGSSATTNASSGTYIAYLFATVAGVSKVGSVVHSGSSTDVDCGFSSGARLVILKRTDATGDWYIWDSVRGIVSGNDPYLLLNTTAAEVTNTDYIDPLSSGFQITGDFTDGTYIFYAIA